MYTQVLSSEKYISYNSKKVIRSHYVRVNRLKMFTNTPLNHGLTELYIIAGTHFNLFILANWPAQLNCFFLIHYSSKQSCDTASQIRYMS